MFRVAFGGVRRHGERVGSGAALPVIFWRSLGEGRGRVQLRGDRAVDAAAGDVARIPAGAEHWHGAHPDEAQAMTHLAITFGAVTWLEPVSEEEYRG